MLQCLHKPRVPPFSQRGSLEDSDQAQKIFGLQLEPAGIIHWQAVRLLPETHNLLSLELSSARLQIDLLDFRATPKDFHETSFLRAALIFSFL